MEMMLALGAVHLGTALKYRRNWNKKNVGIQIIESFNKGKGTKASQKYRLYVPINDPRHPVKVPLRIKEAVEKAGYTITDYIAGLATQKDGKRVMKIGKLIKDEYLRNQFANDENRQAHKDAYTCVISCHPYDIIGMSTGRTWDQFSCMRLGAGSKLNAESNNGEDGVHADTLNHDIAQGTLVAYAIKNSDTNISKPDARLLIKPYMNERREVFFRVETKIYGNPVRGFRETINGWLRKVNANASAGRYSLMKGLYNDGAGSAVRHMGPLAYADLSDPGKLQEWLKEAQHGDYEELFRDGKDEPAILKIIEQSDELYKEYMFNDLRHTLITPDGEMEVENARMEIMLRHLIDLGRDGYNQLDNLMNTYLAKYTPYALTAKMRELLAPYLKMRDDKVYRLPFRNWAVRFNPAFALNTDMANIDPDIDSKIRTGEPYMFIEPVALNAPRKSNLYKVAAVESFVRYANGLLHSTGAKGWRAISPSDVPSDEFIKYDLVGGIKDMKWDDGQTLFAYAANSFDWFNDDNAHLIGLAYIEKLKISDIFINPYVIQLFENGVPNNENDKSIAANFAEVVVRAVRADKEGVKPEESRLYDLASLLGEHDYNTQRYIEREFERALYD